MHGQRKAVTLLSRRSLTLRASCWVSAIWSATRFCSFNFSASISNSVRASCRGRRSTWPFGVFFSMSWPKWLGEMIGEEETKVASSQHLIGWRPCLSYATTAMASLAIVALQLWPKKMLLIIRPSVFSLLKKKMKWQFSTCRSKMNCGNRWMGFTIKPYRVIRSTLDACFLWTQKRVKLWTEVVWIEAHMWLVYNKRSLYQKSFSLSRWILISCLCFMYWGGYRWGENCLHYYCRKTILKVIYRAVRDKSIA